ncbi:MAG: ABC transporter permease [Actinobacteria bacterium]|nr:ABC transporter permease [Actinomycetota bacterium]
MNRLTSARRWLAAIRTATGGVRRHKLQAVVIGAVLLIATASATLGFALLSASNAPFQHAFTAQRGAHAAVGVDAAKASPAQLAATTHLPGVTAAAGPFGTDTVATALGGQLFGQLTLSGRANPGGPVDDLVLSAGHWASGPGQLVLDGQSAPPGSGGPVLGATVTVTSLRGQPKLTIVGFANSVTSTADGWVTPSEITQLQATAPAANGQGTRHAQVPGAQASTQMLYRFTKAASFSQVRADVATVSRALPSGAVTGTVSWLSAANESTGNGSIMEPFVVAFALIGLIMAVLIVGNVVSGAVVASYQRIGVLKSLGLTPGQVVVAYLGRVGWPALAGALFGVVAGNLLALPVLNDSAGAYGVGRQSVPWWASVAAPLGMLALTGLAAAGPAIRAGRLSAVQAIAAGRAPRAGRGYAAHRLAARLRLPRPLGLGLAAPFARPARTLVGLAAICFGATAVIFAVGLSSSLGRAEQAQNHSASAPVVMQQNVNGPQQQFPSAAQDAAMVAVLRAQPGTAHYVAEYDNQVKVTGLAGNVFARVYGGDAAWIGFGQIAGHWPDGPGQIDVNTAFLTQSGLAIGSPVTVNTGTAQVTARIAGEVFDPGGHPDLFGSAGTLPGMATTENLSQYYVGLKPGTTASAYREAVNRALGTGNAWQAYPPQGGNFYSIASELIGLLSLMVAVAAGLGVLNTVLMTTRDRVHDLGVYKALGMRPRQLLVMVLGWVAGPAVIAGAIAAPAAVALNSATVRAMAGTAHTAIPASFTAVFPPSRLALLALAALVIAVAGAFLPASWAARARPATALRTE